MRIETDLNGAFQVLRQMGSDIVLDFLLDFLLNFLLNFLLDFLLESSALPSALIEVRNSWNSIVCFLSFGYSKKHQPGWS